MYFINQPPDKLLDHLERLLDGNFTQFSIVVAYAKRSGIRLLRDAMLRFKQRGGNILAVVGIDQKNTSIEALQELMEICNAVHVFHCEDWTQTFHPKLYYFQNNTNAEVIVGSSNLTNGGLQRNTELNVGSPFRFSVSEERARATEIESIIGSYLRQDGLCLRLDTATLTMLIERNYIVTEERVRQIMTSIASGQQNERAFGRGRTLSGLRTVTPEIEALPSSTTAAVETGSTSAVSSELEPTTASTSSTALDATNVRIGFWKKLSHNDISRTSSPGQIIIPIGFYDMLPPFVNQETKSHGATQEESFFNLLFVNHQGTESVVNNARAIHYTPAPSHARQNREIRFTFRTPAILQILAENDILLFELSNDPRYAFIVRQIKSSQSEYLQYDGRYGRL